MSSLRFEAVKGERVHRYFDSVTLYKDAADLWWNRTKGCWEPLGANPDDAYSSHAPCRTLKAFKRMLRKYPYLVGRAVLVSKYRGFDVYSEDDPYKH